MNSRLHLLLMIICLYLVHPVWSQYDFTISTVAGDGLLGFDGDGGDPLLAEFTLPAGIDIDPTDTYLYIADQCNHRIRRIDLANNIITTIVGSGVGGHSGTTDPNTSSLNFPGDVYVDKNGDVFIVDSGNHQVKKLEVATNMLTVIAGTGTAGYNGDGIAATAAQLNFPRGIEGDEDGNLFIADYYNNRIRKIDANGIITTIAGTGSDEYSGDGGMGTAASLNAPRDVTLDYFGNIYIADSHNHRIRQIDAQTGIISTFGGMGTPDFSGDGGMAAAATFNIPVGLHMTEAGNLYIADLSNFRIRNIDYDTSITTVAGDGGFTYDGDNGSSLNAGLMYPTGLTVSRSGNVYIVDQNAYVVRQLTPTDNVFCGMDCSNPTQLNELDDFANSANITSGAQVVLFADSIMIEGPSGITSWEIFSNTGLKDATGGADMETGSNSTPLFQEVVLGGGRSQYILVGYVPPSSSYSLLITDGVNMFSFDREAPTPRQINYAPIFSLDRCECINSNELETGETNFIEAIRFRGIAGVTFEIKSQNGLFDQVGNPLPIGVASQALFRERTVFTNFNGISIYHINLYHELDKGYNLVISDGVHDYSINNVCTINDCIAGPDISDPCNCYNPDNLVDANTEEVLFFAEEITITTFSDLHLEIVSNNGMLNSKGNLLPIGRRSIRLFTEDNSSPGGGLSTYRLPFWHSPDIGYTTEITDGVNPLFTIGNSCTPCPFMTDVSIPTDVEEIEPIPTLSEHCNCGNPSNIRTKKGEIAYFIETINLTSLPGVTLEIQSQSGLFDRTGAPLPTGTISQSLFNEFPTSSGMTDYQLIVYHQPNKDAALIISDGNKIYTVDDFCSVNDCIAFEPSIGDPCSCRNLDNLIDINTGEIRFFADEITIITLSGLNLEIINNNGMFDRNGNLLPIGIGSRTLFTEDSSTPGGGISTYHLSLWHAANIGYTTEITDGINPVFTIGNSCTPCPVDTIPLTDHLGLLFIGFIVISIGLFYTNRLSMI